MLLTIVNIVTIVLGIGFLIFIHELGHFLVAKKVGIKVEAFSLGFGPRLFGFVRGETEYKCCAIPLGGYVKMAGEMPGEGTGDPRDFGSKTIGQRAWVVSAGVIMNVVVAFIIFPIAFSMGVPFDAPVIGAVTPGGPAWKGDVRAGDRVLEVNGTEILGFRDIQYETVFASGQAEFKLERDGGEITRLVEPVYSKEIGVKTVGIYGAYETVRFQEGAPALDADVNKGVSITTEDEVVSVGGFPVRHFLSTPYPGIGSQFSGDVEVILRGPDGTERAVQLAPRLEPTSEARWRLGLTFCDVVKDYVRSGGNGRIEKTLPEAVGIKVGDAIVKVGDRDVFSRTQIDGAIFATPVGQPLRLSVRRAGAIVPLEEHVMREDDAAAFCSGILWGADGLRVRVEAGGPGHLAGLRDGDVFVGYAGETFDDDEGRAELIAAIKKGEGATADAVVRRGDQTLTFKVTPVRAMNNVAVSQFRVEGKRTESHVAFPHSIVAGSRQAWNQGKNIVMVLKSLLSGDVSARVLGGPIMIAEASYTLLQQGLAKFLFFLGILSLNLAILNILPIPVLDGGHLVFLILEKIKGGPISERAMAYATYAGLFLMLSLMVFVTFNDIRRLLT